MQPLEKNMEAYLGQNIFSSFLGKIVERKQDGKWSCSGEECVQKYNTGRLGGANGYYPKVKRFIKISGMELIECREITVVVNFVIRGFKF